MQENNTKTIHRLQEYCTNTGISLNRIAVDLGISNSYFSKMVRNSGSIGSDILEKILLHYPDINPEWLLTGKGAMKKEIIYPKTVEKTEYSVETESMVKERYETNEYKKDKTFKGDCIEVDNKVYCTGIDFVQMRQEMKIFEDLKKAHKVLSLYNSVLDFIGDLYMSHCYSEHYYHGRLHELITAFINKKIDKSLLIKEFMSNMNTVSELDKVITPYKPIIRELYVALEEFDNQRDRLFHIDEKDVQQ